MTYLLSFKLNTDTDPSVLLDMLQALAEGLSWDVEDEESEDPKGEPVSKTAEATETAVETLNQPGEHHE